MLLGIIKLIASVWPLPPPVAVGPIQCPAIAGPNTGSGGSTVLGLNGHHVWAVLSMPTPTCVVLLTGRERAKKACGSFVTSRSQLATWPLIEILILSHLLFYGQDTSIAYILFVLLFSFFLFLFTSERDSVMASPGEYHGVSMLVKKREKSQTPRRFPALAPQSATEP